MKIQNAVLFFVLAVFAAGSPGAETFRALDKADLFLGSPPPERFERCGTPYLMELLRGGAEKPSAFASAYMTLDRPTLARYADSKEGHFRVHYNVTGDSAPNLTDADGNGIPDYVDSTLVYFEYAWKTISGLGYPSPKSDVGRGGSDAVDVYLQELSSQKFYGYCGPDSATGSAYVVVDDDFQENIYPTKGYAALRITSAHEFFHVIHYSMYGGDSAVWWMEQTSVWMEDYTWDDVNDYLNYATDFLSNRETSLDSNGPFMYSASLFAFMLAKKHGPGVIRSVWNRFRDSQSGSIELLNPIIPGGLPQAVSDLGVWTWFTGARANPVRFFSDSPLIKGGVVPSDTVFVIPAADSLSLRRYTFKYIDLAPQGGFSPSDSIRFGLFDRDGGPSKRQIILYNSPDDFETVPLDGSSPLLTFSRSFRKAVLVAANTSSQGGGFRLAYTIARETGQEKPVTAFTLDRNFPNPFNKETVIRFTVPQTARVRICILNIGGQTVAVLTDGLRERGTHSITFAPDRLSSGVYFAVLESGGVSITRKMAYIR